MRYWRCIDECSVYRSDLTTLIATLFHCLVYLKLKTILVMLLKFIANKTITFNLLDKAFGFYPG